MENFQKGILTSKLNLFLSKFEAEPKYLNYFYVNHYKEIDDLYLINQEDIKILKFIMNYLFISEKYKDITMFWKFYSNNSSKNIKNIKIRNHKIIYYNKIIIKFINFCLINISFLSEFINIKKDLLNEKIYKIINILFLNGIISLDDINIILILKLILCLYNENNKNIKNENININININNDIKNIKEFYSLIDFLLSFINNNMSQEKKIEFNKLIVLLMKNIQKIFFINNINNIFILSRNNYLFKLIKLNQISEEISNSIIPLLINVYKNKFNIDYIYEDLSEQFVIKSKENIFDKTNYLISKNVFLNMLFSQEERKNDIRTINNGFIFNNFENNGIICYASNQKSIKFPKDGYTIVISFNLMKNDKSKKYNIFSFYQKDNNIIMNIFIKNKKLKFFYNNKEYELFDNIEINENYIFWMVYPKEKNSEILFFLNNSKKFIPYIIYPSGEYDEILIGFNKDINNNNISIDNFEGLIGTFILFNKCLIKDKNDNQNENKLIELKGDYEMIVDISNKRDFIFVNRNNNLILNKFLLERV